VLPEGVFAGLISLQSLNLEGNGLATLPVGVFAGLIDLHSLDLAGNDLRALPEKAFAGLSGLQSLNLSTNTLTALSEGAFADLTSLQSLDLAGNDLRALPEKVFAGLSGLEAMNLRSNGLTTLPEGAFAGLSDLESLDLGYNDLTALSTGTFAGLSDLESLDLGGNGLTTLPEGMFAGLSDLESLDLSYNDLTALPAGTFIGLSGLESLRLTANPGSPFELSVRRRRDSWCDAQQFPSINFQRNGKTVSVCKNEDGLTYFVGHLDAEPELLYSGRILAEFGGPAVMASGLVGEDGNLANLAGWTNDPEERELVAELACATATNGFIELSGYTGYYRTGLYIFRKDGWQHEVGGQWGRTFNLTEGTDEFDAYANYQEYSLTTRSPDEQVHCLAESG
jgi:hypothetical protein